MGIQKEKIYVTVASTLERNRLVDVTKSTGAAAYSSYGSAPDGWLDTRATANDGGAIYAIGNLDTTMKLKLQTGVTKGNPVFAGANGQVVGTLDYTVISKTQPYTQPAGSNGDKYIAPANVTAWTLPAQNVAGEILQKGASVWTQTAATAGMLVYVTDEARYYVCSATNTWTLAKLVGYAAETGVAGEEVEIINTKSTAKILPEQLPNNMNLVVICSGVITITGSATTGTLVDARIAATDIPVANFLTMAGSAATLKTVVPTTSTITATVGTAPGGTDSCTINVVVFRKIA